MTQGLLLSYLHGTSHEGGPSVPHSTGRGSQLHEAAC